MATSALTAQVVSWAFYDGAGDEDSETGDNPEAPFATGLDALRAGWRLLSAAPILPASPGLDHVTSYQKFDFFRKDGCRASQGAGERLIVAKAETVEKQFTSRTVTETVNKAKGMITDGK